MEIKTGGRQNGQRIYSALKILDYINSMSENKMCGIQKISKNITIFTKEECIPIKKIENKIVELDEMINQISKGNLQRYTVNEIIYFKKILREILKEV